MKQLIEGKFYLQRKTFDTILTNNSSFIIADDSTIFSMTFNDVEIEVLGNLVRLTKKLLDYYSCIIPDKGIRPLVNGIYVDKNGIITMRKTNKCVGFTSDLSIFTYLLKQCVKNNNNESDDITLNIEDMFSSIANMLPKGQDVRNIIKIHSKPKRVDYFK